MLSWSAARDVGVAVSAASVIIVVAVPVAVATSSTYWRLRYGERCGSGGGGCCVGEA